LPQFAVTKTQHFNNEFNIKDRIPTYSKIIANTITKLVDKNKNPHLIIFPNVLPKQILQSLPNYVNNIPQKMKVSLKGATKTFALGYYLDRTGILSASPINNTFIGKAIIALLQPIAKIISKIVQKYDNNFYNFITNNVPQQYLLFGICSAFYCNLLPPSLTHRDEKDEKWCFIFPFGSLKKTGLHLPYCNAFVEMNETDFVMLNSKYIWHAADGNVPINETRYSGVLTIHSGLIKKFI
jgi:hypothetical protein